MSLEHYHQAKNITIIGGSINLILSIAKTLGGIFYQSHALLADGVHSLFDLIIDATVLFAAKFGYQSADEEHPYGHQRIQTAATLILALILVLTGFGIAYDGVIKIVYPESLHPTWGAFIIAFITLVINEILFHKTYQVANKIQSSLMHASAWHKRSDTMTSLVVLIAIGGSLIGIPYLDSAAAILVGLLIVKMGITYGWDSIKELVDTAADPEFIKTIAKHIARIPGVKKVHQLRSRTMGKDIFIDLHILVESDISVSEGHYIGVQVHYSLMHKFPNIKDVTVHIDPEDDEIATPSLKLANRKTIHKKIVAPLKDHLHQAIAFNMHYLNGKIILDLYFSTPADKNQLKSLVAPTLLKQLNISKINYFYKL